MTLVVYFGTQWDGPLSLREMYAVTDEHILQCTPDYRVNLLAPDLLTDTQMTHFHSSLREVMLYLKYAKDKQKLDAVVKENEQFRHLDRQVAEVINVITHSDLQYPTGEEEIDMCKAIQDMREESEARGKVSMLIKQVCKKIAKQLSIAEIADALEEPEEEISKIVSVAKTFAPDYDVDKIYEALQTT